MKLLVRPFAKTDESFNGYINRLALVNSASLNNFIYHIGLTSTQFLSSSTKVRAKIAKEVSVLTGYGDITCLFDIRDWGNDFKHLFDYKTQKCCLACLADVQYIRAIWDFKYYTLCHIHKIPLVSKCSFCETRLTASAVLAGFCKVCSENLSINEYVSVFNDQISSYIATKFKFVDSSEQKTCIQDIAEFMRQLRPFFNLSVNGDLRKIELSRHMDIESFVTRSDDAYELKKNHHKSAEKLTDLIVERVSDKSLAQRFNNFRYVIKSPSKYEFSKVIKKTITDNLKEQTDHYITLSLIAQLWEIDLKRLKAATDKVAPSLVSAKKGIRCSDFARHSEKILTLVNSNK